MEFNSYQFHYHLAPISHLSALHKFPPTLYFPPFSSTCPKHQWCFNSNKRFYTWHSGASGFVSASLNLQDLCIIPSWVHCYGLFGGEGLSVKCPEEPTVLQTVRHRNKSSCHKGSIWLRGRGMERNGSCCACGTAQSLDWLPSSTKITHKMRERSFTQLGVSPYYCQAGIIQTYPV